MTDESDSKARVSPPMELRAKHGSQASAGVPAVAAPRGGAPPQAPAHGTPGACWPGPAAARWLPGQRRRRVERVFLSAPRLGGQRPSLWEGELGRAHHFMQFPPPPR